MKRWIPVPMISPDSVKTIMVSLAIAGALWLMLAASMSLGSYILTGHWW